jgi:hypothetical protein
MCDLPDAAFDPLLAEENTSREKHKRTQKANSPSESITCIHDRLFAIFCAFRGYTLPAFTV